MDSIEIANKIRESKIQMVTEKMRRAELLYSDQVSEESGLRKGSTDDQEDPD